MDMADDILESAFDDMDGEEIDDLADEEMMKVRNVYVIFFIFYGVFSVLFTIYLCLHVFLIIMVGWCFGWLGINKSSW